MEKEKVTTRLDALLRRRLKIYAAAAGLTVEDVVSSALDRYLPQAQAEVALTVPSGRAGGASQPINERGPGAGTPGPQTV